jgi:hypothetical protein
MKFKNIYLQFIILITVLLTPVFASADYSGQKTNFFVDSDFEKNSETMVSSTLQVDSIGAYFYIEDEWYNSLTESEKKEIESTLNSLGIEFINNIYRNLTANYGSEWNPGIDKDRKITVLFHQMKENGQGYVRTIDEYEKILVPMSNQREMVYLNVETLNSSLLKNYLAHEFTHLIEFNQKEKRTGTAEEVWLNELRAEYSSTLLGYNDSSDEDNYLKKRVSTFLNNPFDSLTEWKGEMSDYGVISMFGHYLADHYGANIILESLRVSSKVGIESINETLTRKGINEKFSDIFADWLIASYLNDCTANQKYCYKNPNLANLHVIPFNNFIPYTSESTLSVSQTFSNWSANWQKFSGSNKSLVINFDGKSQAGLKVLYVIRDYSGKYTVKYLTLDDQKKGQLPLSNLGTDIASLMIIPFVENENISSDIQTHYFYNITISTLNNTTTTPVENNNDIKLPFTIDKPLNQMNREELLMILLKVIIYLASQGKLQF